MENFPEGLNSGKKLEKVKYTILDYICLSLTVVIFAGLFSVVFLIFITHVVIKL
jgi:hypothetical protein